MKTEELLGVGVPLLFVLLLWVEARRPARTFESMPRWRWIGATFFVLTLVIGSVTPLFIPSAYLKSHSVLDLSGLGLWGLPVGVLATRSSVTGCIVRSTALHGCGVPHINFTTAPCGWTCSARSMHTRWRWRSRLR